MHTHYTHTLNTHTLICRDQLRDSLLAIITQQSKKPLSAALVAPATLASLSSWYSPFPFFLFSHKHLKNCSNLMYHLQVERRLRGWLRFCVGFWFFSLFVLLAFFLAFSLSLSLLAASFGPAIAAARKLHLMWFMLLLLLHRFYSTVVVVRGVNLLKFEERDFHKSGIRSGCPRASFDCFL